MDKITQLNQTVDLMDSESYKERFIAEYAQITIRMIRLRKALDSIKDNTYPKCFKPTCDIDVLNTQLNYMSAYRGVLIFRASIEEIELPEVEV